MDFIGLNYTAFTRYLLSRGHTRKLRFFYYGSIVQIELYSYYSIELEYRKSIKAHSRKHHKSNHRALTKSKVSITSSKDIPLYKPDK